ncbi:NYN domain-containing protein [Nostoc sp. FACHB-152]|uniref:NYN domain-containing protein n=1 Tax=unclassified Nostoc TaxID=2593658 RepID=UPI00168456C1|nr:MULTISPECIES: NYN domain-containing protein [unclassified Nostoc]MBD2446276.1 NYN domain-containing protein [Nostoc sp. FACHB-152]MBD2469546.1 NYN domain-containing protein [Nostoc sp. FACHB-145]
MSYATQTELNGSGNVTHIKSSKLEQPASSLASVSKTEIAVLLLDAENLQINTETEKFLTTVCTYPIQIKIAFANWCSMGKLDIDLHGRGYDLIHVPVGKDNADGKMITFGSSIHERYPKAREVLVCSSDKVMINLCNHLQQHGLTVYQVSKQGEDITVLNSYTGQLVRQVANSIPEIPTIAQFIAQIKELIKAEQKQTQNIWIKLNTISKNYKSKYKLTIGQVVAKHFPGQKAREIFINHPTEFVLHQIEQAAEVYITLFEINSNSVNSQNAPGASDNKSQLLSKIATKLDLEHALQNIINELTIHSPGSYINIGPLGSQFKQQYGKPITEQIKSLQLSGNFLKFVQSCNSFKLRETPKGWEIAIK